MNIFRWILAVPSALAIIIALSQFIMFPADAYLVSRLDYNWYICFHGCSVAILFLLFILLNCWFSPKPKKYMVLAAGLVILIIAVAGTIVQLTDKNMGDTTIVSVISLFSLFGGSSAGIIISYYVFRKRGWNAFVNKTEVSESY